MSSNIMEPTARNSLAYAFPGVGVKLCGRESGFYETYFSVMNPFIEAASESCRINLAKALQNGTIEDMPDGDQQFFTYAYCAGVLNVFRQHGVMPNLVAGFSFGIYAALYAADAISYASGLTMLREAYLLMDERSQGKDYGMGIVVGLEQSEISRLLEKNNYQTLCVVNTTNDTCYILSGTKTELRDLLQGAMERDAYSAEVLPVDIAYHHPTLLGDVSEKFAAQIQGIEWTDPTCPVVSSIDQTLLKNAADLKDFAARNLTTPIHWKEVVLAMERAGVTRIIECGPGLSLTQNGRFISSSMTYTNIKKARRWLQN